MNNNHLLSLSNGEGYIIDDQNNSQKIKNYQESKSAADVALLNKIFANSQQLFKLVPEDKQNQFCLFFGNRIIFSSEIWQEALDKKIEYEKNNLYVQLFVPTTELLLPKSASADREEVPTTGLLLSQSAEADREKISKK